MNRVYRFGRSILVLLIGMNELYIYIHPTRIVINTQRTKRGTTETERKEIVPKLPHNKGSPAGWETWKTLWETVWEIFWEQGGSTESL
jgi:hypothetical protein